jgi:hypothetical protein
MTVRVRLAPPPGRPGRPRPARPTNVALDKRAPAASPPMSGRGAETFDGAVGLVEIASPAGAR